MEGERVTDALLREFLLGKVSDEVRELIESEFLTESHARERIFAVEQDLIEDYLEDNLSAEDKELFLSIYAHTAEDRRKLRITRSIKDWAVTEAALHETTSSVTSTRSRAHALARPAFLIPITAAALVLIAVVAVWMNLDRNDQTRDIERQVVQLNDPSNRVESPDQTTSVTLAPVTLRGLSQQNQIRVPAGIRVVELHLPWIQPERYSKYEAKLHLKNDRVVKVPNLPGEQKDGYEIRVKFPAQLFDPGDYQLNLTGTVDDGATSPTQEYNFSVVK